MMFIIPDPIGLMRRWASMGTGRVPFSRFSKRGKVLVTGLVV
jgi:hypothetical protein